MTNKEEIQYHNRIWYLKTYEALVIKALKRGLSRKKLDYYTEKHHILPKCMNGKDSKDNYVLLTFREHIIAHMLLSRMYPNNNELSHVVYFMLSSSKNNNIYNNTRRTKFKISNTKELEEIRIKSVEYLREINTGKFVSEETKLRISKGKSGLKLSEDAKRSMALGRVGMVFTEERKKKISDALKGQKISDKSLKLRKLNIIRRKKVQAPDNTVYNSIKECSDSLNIEQEQLEDWIINYPEKGYKSIGSSKIKVIDPNGVVHNSISECARVYKKDPKSIKGYIENYPEFGFKYYIEN